MSDLNNVDLDENNLELATILKNKRKELGLSLKDLELISGVSSSYIHRLETNSRKSPSIQTLKKLTVALTLDMGKLPGILPEDIINSNNIMEVIKKENLSFREIYLSNPEKNRICDIIGYILECNWNNESKIEDIKKILDLVDRIKK